MTTMLPPMGEDELRALFSAPTHHDPYWVHFDIENQTVDALELVLDHLRRLPDHPLSWKWVLIGMHTALHGSFGLAIAGSTGAALLKPWQERQYWERVNIERETGERQNFFTFTSTNPRTGKLEEVPPKVDSFPNLYRKVRQEKRMHHLGGKPLVPSQEQAASIKLVNQKRNDLVHFSTTSLIYDVHRMLDAIPHALSVVRFLLTQAQPLDTITDHLTAGKARILLTTTEAEMGFVGLRYALEAQRGTHAS